MKNFSRAFRQLNLSCKRKSLFWFVLKATEIECWSELINVKNIVCVTISQCPYCVRLIGKIEIDPSLVFMNVSFLLIIFAHRDLSYSIKINSNGSKIIKLECAGDKCAYEIGQSVLSCFLGITRVRRVVWLVRSWRKSRRRPALLHGTVSRHYYEPTRKTPSLRKLVPYYVQTVVWAPRFSEQWQTVAYQ